MSTVIEGYTFNGSMRDLLDTCVRFREKFIEIKADLIGGFLDHGTPSYKIAEKIEERTRSGIRDPFNISAAVVAYPLRRKIYVNVFDNDILSLVRKDKRFKDFSYWDNTDRPEELTAREWRRREKLWDEIMPSATPSIDGFTYDFGSDTFSTRYKIAERIVKMGGGKP